MGYEPLDGVTTYGNIFRMHLVFTNRCTLHWAERTGTDVQGQLLALDTTGIQLVQDGIGKVQTSSRRGHTSLDFRIYGLISTQVALLSLAVQIGRNGQFTHSVQDFCERNQTAPFEVNPLTRAVFATTGSPDLYLLILDGDSSDQRTFLPFLQVAHQTEPGTPFGGLKHLFIVGRLGGLQQEYFYQSTRILSFLVRLAEMQTSLNDACIVHHHQRTLRQVFRQVIEHVLSYLTLTIQQ